MTKASCPLLLEQGSCGAVSPVPSHCVLLEVPTASTGLADVLTLRGRENDVTPSTAAPSVEPSCSPLLGWPSCLALCPEGSKGQSGETVGGGGLTARGPARQKGYMVGRRYQGPKFGS